MKKLYYTVERGLSSDGETIDGTKSAQVYSIENNEPKILCNVHMDLTNNTQNHIKMYLEDELQMDVKKIELVIL